MKMKFGANEIFEEIFPVVNIEGISLKDEFLYSDEIERFGLQTRIKNHVIQAKQNRMKNFRHSAYDPSLDDDGKTIIYKKGKYPAVGKSAIWWHKNLINVMPEKNSRQGNNIEYDVFLATRIKYLYEEKRMDLEDAWRAVCNYSADIGHYLDSKDANVYEDLENTGNRPIGEFYDLGNTFKFIQNYKTSDFLIAGGAYNVFSNEFQLASINDCDNSEEDWYNAVGWVVLSL